jgi:taurine dioxygenase
MSTAAPYLKRQYPIGDLTVAPLTPTIGAAISGIELAAAPSPAEIEAVREALRRHKVLFFRRQQLTVSEFVAFARAFGPLQTYGCFSTDGSPTDKGAMHQHPEVHVFEYDASRRGKEAFWHFDVLPNRRPARAAMLRARIVPEVGGDTLFCELETLYQGLPPSRKDRLEDAVGVYDLHFERRLARFRGKSEREVMALSDEPFFEAPLVVRRPCDGRKVLFVNPAFLVGIKDAVPTESEAIAADLRARIARPEGQCRFRWDIDDVAFWDNGSCLHYATNDYFPGRRVMERVTLLDDAPRPR